ncbi:MAG: hypothetical protein JNL19_01080 [Burkholderiales bacterium]|nr:hypothetical protein [Burkholderiales bacterium]
MQVSRQLFVGLILFLAAAGAQAQIALESNGADPSIHQYDQRVADTPKVNPGNISLEGSWAYTISSGTVRLQAGVIANRRSSGVSGSLRVELWALPSPYSGGSATGYKIGQSSVLSPLTAGFQYTNIDQTVAQLATPPAGTWYMYMFISEYNASSLNDGFAWVDWETFSNPTWVIGSVAYPDLVVTSVSLSVRTATVGQRISTQTTTVRNNGSATAPAGARVKFYWSTNNIISLADTYSGWYCDVGTLAPGQSTTCSGQVDAPSTVGTYYFGAYVNEDGAVTESDYSNNTNYDPLTVNITNVAAYPDLVVVSTSIGTRLASSGQRLTSQSTTIRNAGSAAAPSGARIKFYWSTNSIISTADIYSGWYCDVGALAPGQTMTCAGSVDAPSAPGTYYFGAYVNEDGVVIESDYNNNTGYDPLMVSIVSGSDATTDMVEYYHPPLDYYFMTSRSNEIALLDATPPFRRTGLSFRVYSVATGLSSAFGTRMPITRFYFDKVAVSATRGSHFYTLVPSELSALTSLNPTNSAAPRLPYNEGIDSYAYVPVVEGVGGRCATGLIPVYRVFRGNARFPDNPNHRFTTSLSTYSAFVALGWDGEGVKFCVPS